MASTPIYNWPTPDNTDLVKNGALAIRTLGDAIDTTVDTMIPETIFAAKGDLLGASANDTPAVLTVGANGETLVADSSTSTGLKWAIPAMTLIKRASFSAVANTGTTFDDVFSSTYKSYQIVLESFAAATNTDEVHLQFRYAGPTTDNANYFGNMLSVIYSNTTTTNSNYSSVGQMVISPDAGSTTQTGAGNIFVNGVGVNDYAKATSTYTESQGANSAQSFFIVQPTRIRTGFLLKSSSTNITGTVAVYGLA
jgi:hypothetical protein